MRAVFSVLLLCSTTHAFATQMQLRQGPRSFTLTRLSQPETQAVLTRWCQRVTFAGTVCTEDPIPTLQATGSYARFYDLTCMTSHTEVLAFQDDDKLAYLTPHPSARADATRFLLCLESGKDTVLLHDLVVAPSLFEDDDVRLFAMLRSYADTRALDVRTLYTGAHDNRALFRQMFIASTFVL